MDPEARYRALAAHLKDDEKGLELASQLWEAGGSWESALGVGDVLPLPAPEVQCSVCGKWRLDEDVNF